MVSRARQESLGCQLVLILAAWLWSYFGFEFVLLELAIEGGLADAQNASGRELVSAGFAKGVQDGAALEFAKGQQFIFIRSLLSGRILEVGGQIPDVNN